MLKQKSFTLIELLVVIAVIGLLSSIVLVSMDLPGQRQKARIAKSLEFSSSIQNALGAEAVGIWEFDEGSGTVATDRSGLGNNGTIYGASYATNTPQRIVGSSPGKYALSFNGANDYVEAAISPQPVYEYTIEAWIYPLQKENKLIIKRAHCDAVWTDSTNINHAIKRADHSGAYEAVMSISFLENNKWNFMAWTVNLNTQQASMFVNGNYVTRAIGIGNDIALFQGNFRIAKDDADGGCFGGAGYFPGLIDEVRIYSQALSIGQIQKHYAEGLKKYQYAKR